MHKLSFFLVLTLFFAGCGAVNEFNQAKTLEKKGFYIQAVEKYRDVSQKYAKTKYGPASLYFAADIYRDKLKIYVESSKLYSELISRFSDKQFWVKISKIGIFNSPDYFPLKDGYSWVDGDSATLGNNMKAEYKSKLISNISQSDSQSDLGFQFGYTYSVTKKIYAGSNLVTEVKRYYIKDEYELREMTDLQSSDYTVLLSYPFEINKMWVTQRDKRKLKYLIVADGLTIETKAGKFDNCLKVREEDVLLPGSYKYMYFSPDVGMVMVSVGSASVENRTTELLSFK